MIRILYLFGLVFSVHSASAPFITPCKAGDAACVLSSARAAMPYFMTGVPELGIKPMDPMHIDMIQSDQAGLKMVFKNTVITGMKGCTLENVKMDFTKMKTVVSVKCNMALKGDYKLSGQLLILPVQGEGPYNIDIRDMSIKVVSEIGTEKDAEGRPHWKVTSWKHSYKVLSGASFNFQNLFNGNTALAAPVIEFANSNWQDVMQEIAPPIVRAVISEVVAAVDALYKAVPADELYIP